VASPKHLNRFSLQEKFLGSKIKRHPHRWAVSNMTFELIDEIIEIEVIAIGNNIRELARLRKQYGRGRWRKLKGVAHIRLVSGRIRLAEFHW